KQARGTRQLPKPTPQLWQEIANLYNNCVSMLDKDVPPSTAEEIETWLQKAAANVRNYKFPSVGSLDAFNSQDDSNQTSENLLISSDNSPMADMIAEEEFHARQDEISRLNEVLSTALKALDNQSQQIFRLYYREELTQQQIMQQLQTNQSMISRKLRKGKEFLLEKLLEWGKSLHIFVNPNQIKDMSNALEEWLQNHLGDSNMTL
ncbi:MAG: sigma-70 family RNA polymerase sigma factor, partial [Cyanobacteria bacterium J06636_27]